LKEVATIVTKLINTDIPQQKILSADSRQKNGSAEDETLSVSGGQLNR
jgi:hypothetical protein